MKLKIGKVPFDCDSLILTLKKHNVEPSHGHMKLDPENFYYNEYVNQTRQLENAGYDERSVEYRHYQGGVHFDNVYVEQIATLVDAKPVLCWVSEVSPGKCVPWHWDINPWEKEHEKLGTLVRYFCFLSKPEPGHIFVTENECFYMEEQGTVYQYPHIHAWHAGSNVGLTPKYLLTFTGYK